MQRRNFVKILGVGTAGMVLSSCLQKKKPVDHPNIIYILADDLGYGDISTLNPDGKIKTPNIDYLAKSGMTFTDAHSGSAVCTPTRYGILTGRYAWRSRLKSGVLAGYSPALINNNRTTVASLLKDNGYKTACIGKWHLGWNWATKNGYQYSDLWNETGEHVDYSKPISNGPVDVGFNYFYGISASLDILPYCYIENEYTVIPPTQHIDRLDGYGFYRGGPISEGFVHEHVLPELTEKAVHYIKQQETQPFFLYFPLTAPHTPILPSKEFQGKSGIGPYGDFVLQCDWVVKQVIDALKSIGQLDNTLLIFTSDNGCSPMANYKHLEEKGHDPSYIYRGTKADIFEGGHRIPFLVSWPSRIKPGKTCDNTVSLTDLVATTAELTGQNLLPNVGEDSYSMLPLFDEKNDRYERKSIIHHSINGSFAIRQGKWKLNLCPGSGGWSHPVPAEARYSELPRLQLYNIVDDPEETTNLVNQYPKVVFELQKLLENHVARGRSNPGPPVPNDREIDIWETTKQPIAKRKPTKIDHLATDCKVANLNNAEIKFAKNGMAALTDGFSGSENFNDSYWAGIEEDDLSVVIDLSKQVEISEISTRFLKNLNTWIFLPEHVTISLSGDGKKFQKIHTETFRNKPSDKNGIEQVLIKKKFPGIQYIKLDAIGVKVCPKWHPGSDGKAWLFIDEIIIK